VPGEALSAEDKTVQLQIDALKEAAPWPGAGRRILAVLATSSWRRALPGGHRLFATRSGSTPAGALSQALAGAFEPRLGGRAEEAIAKLDATTGPRSRAGIVLTGPDQAGALPRSRA